MMKSSEEELTQNIQKALIQTSAESTNIPAIINEIDNYYKQGTLLYAEGISRYNIEIAKLKNRIEEAVTAKEKEEIRLSILEQELAIESRLLDQLQDEFMQKLYSIEELSIEYKKLIDKAKYIKIFIQKRRELSAVEVKIEELEFTYLSYELEHINSLSILEPKRRYIDTLKENLKVMELEKEHFASTKLHQLPQMGLSNSEVTNEENTEIVDTSILEKES